MAKMELEIGSYVMRDFLLYGREISCDRVFVREDKTIITYNHDLSLTDEDFVVHFAGDGVIDIVVGDKSASYDDHAYICAGKNALEVMLYDFFKNGARHAFHRTNCGIEVRVL